MTTYTPPQQITFHSDSNVLQYTRIAKGKIVTYVYTYIKSRTKKGSELSFGEEEINNLKRKEIIACR